jgi:predicted O-methyltransferase YrrM
VDPGDAMNPALEILHVDQIVGWMEPDELDWLYETAKTASRALEIGCFMGRSTCALLAGMRDGSKGRLTVIDTFDARGTSRAAEFSGPRGTASLLKEFRDNVSVRGLGLPEVLIGPSESREIRAKIPDASLDLIFIDGAHDFDSVSSDLYYDRKLRPGGIMSGHDYDHDSPGLIEAVDTFFGRKPERPCGAIWAIRKT